MSRASLLAAMAGAAIPWVVVALAAGSLRARRARGGARPLVAVLARLGQRLGVPGAPRDLGARIAAAGLGDRVGVAEAMAVKVGAAAVGLLIASGPATLLPGPLGRILLLAGPVAGFLGFDGWLRRRIRRRGQRLAVELPDALELLRVAVETGLSPWRAIDEVAKRHRGLIGAELRIATARIGLGASRDETLGQLVARCPLPAVVALAAALGRAERHGSPLGPTLAALAADVRAERTRVMRERAARAAPKIQLAIALLLVPGVLLLVAAALGSASGR